MRGNTDPVRLILDTDMGNDIDDALALAMIHALQTRGECRLVAVTISKDNRFAPQYVDLLNTFYGRGDIPIGVVRDGPTPDDGTFVRQVVELKDNGRPRYACSYPPDGYADAVTVLRSVLADQPDHSVVPVMIGFSTNLARLLQSPPDDVSDLPGRELFARKVRHVVMMAANFAEKTKANPNPDTVEYNIRWDVPAAKAFLAGCPSPILFSGFEIGAALMYPGPDTEHLFGWTTHHPVADAYRRFLPTPYDRPSWDLTAVLVAARPEARYFGVSVCGTAVVQDDAIVRFTPGSRGSHRHLTLIESQQERIIKAMVDLVTQPTTAGAIHITATLATDGRRRAGTPVARSDGSFAAARTNLK